MAPPPRQGSPAGWIIAIIAGALAVLAALGLGGLSAATFWLNSQRDAQGYVSTAARTLASDTAAITVEDVNLEFEPNFRVWSMPADFGNVRVQATAPGETPIFIGIAPQADVDAWLRNVAHQRLTRLTDQTVVYGDNPGRQRAAPPTRQDFWTAQATGTGTQTLTWPIRSGTWAFVLARADGAPGVQADVDVGASIPSLTPVAIGLLIAAVVAFLIGVALIILGAVGLGRRRSATPPSQPGYVQT